MGNAVVADERSHRHPAVEMSSWGIRCYNEMPLGRFQFVSFVQVDLRWHLEELCVQGDTDTHPFNCEGVTNFKMGIREVEGLQQRKKRVAGSQKAGAML